MSIGNSGKPSFQTPATLDRGAELLLQNGNIEPNVLGASMEADEDSDLVAKLLFEFPQLGQVPIVTFLVRGLLYLDDNIIRVSPSIVDDDVGEHGSGVEVVAGDVVVWGKA